MNGNVLCLGGGDEGRRLPAHVVGPFWGFATLLWE